MRSTIIILLCLNSGFLLGQKKKKQDIEAIKSMCGCYEVEFQYAETFAGIRDYQFHDNYMAKALEYVFPITESADKIALQHLLIVKGDMIIKHWRQDWLYENTDLYQFDKNNSWKYQALAPSVVKGQWTQKVYQVDDGPRYEGSATWVHTDGRHYWDNKTPAPLPRREHTKRSDYNVMIRGNRQEITNDGWVHEQDNDKVLRNNNEDQLIAKEKGLNTYTKVEDEKCKVAQTWWKDHKQYWADVRAVWDELFDSKKPITIASKINDKILYQNIFALEKELLDKANYDSTTARSEIRQVIQFYLKSEQKLVSIK